MSTDQSGQRAAYASNASGEPVDEPQTSGQQVTQTSPVGSEQAATPAAGTESVGAPLHNQQQGPGQAPGGEETATAAAAGSQQDPDRRPDDAGGFREQEGQIGPNDAGAFGGQTGQVGPNNAGSLGGQTGQGGDGTGHALIADPAGYARRWESIQVGFVDDPRSAVQDAEAIVSDVMKEMIGIFQRERQHLEEQWSGGNQASTDDLRIAFQRYRDFFQRFLQV